MSWFRDGARDDPFEYFTTLYPLSSSLHVPISPPTLSPSPAPIPPSCSNTSAFGNIVNDTPTLERDFCSDFACCGLLLADLHELLEHFEESHVAHFSPAGPDVDRRTHTAVAPSIALYPVAPLDVTCATKNLNTYSNNLEYASPLALASRSSFSSSSSGSSASSPALSPLSLSFASSPISPTTPSPVDSMAHFSPCDCSPQQQLRTNLNVGLSQGDFNGVDARELGNALVGVHISSDVTSRIPSHPNQLSEPQPQISPPTCLPPSSFTVPIPIHKPVPVRSRPSNAGPYSRPKPKVRPAVLDNITQTTEKEPMDGVEVPMKISSSPLPLPSESRTPISTNLKPILSVSTSVIRPAHVRMRRQGHGSSLYGRHGKRERMYKCPRSGCTKAYLNPNGLKYHVEKGKCTTETEGTA